MPLAFAHVLSCMCCTGSAFRLASPPGVAAGTRGVPVEDWDVVRVRSSVVDEASDGVSGLRGAGTPAHVRADVLALGASRSRNLAGGGTHPNSANSLGAAQL